MSDKYLLIIPCSKRKVGLPGAKIPAKDLYDGPFYRIIRRAFRENGHPEQLDVLILSAKYGLISSHDLIENYDKKMTPYRAMELSDSIREKLLCYFNDNHYREIFVNLGKSYIPALDNCIDIFKNRNVTYASGMIGERMQQLKIWMNNILNRINDDTVG